MEDQNPEQQTPEKTILSLEMENGKIRCQIEGEHDNLVRMIASLLVESESPLREIINHSLLVVMQHETKKINEETINDLINQMPKGEA